MSCFCCARRLLNRPNSVNNFRVCSFLFISFIILLYLFNIICRAALLGFYFSGKITRFSQQLFIWRVVLYSGTQLLQKLPTVLICAAWSTRNWFFKGFVMCVMIHGWLNETKIEKVNCNNEEFDAIITHLNFPEEYLLSCFLGGLKKDTQMLVKMFQLGTLRHFLWQELILQALWLLVSISSTKGCWA